LSIVDLAAWPRTAGTPNVIDELLDDLPTLAVDDPPLGSRVLATGSSSIDKLLRPVDQILGVDPPEFRVRWQTTLNLYQSRLFLGAHSSEAHLKDSRQSSRDSTRAESST
jgi:hypothetical protein